MRLLERSRLPGRQEQVYRAEHGQGRARRPRSVTIHRKWDAIISMTGSDPSRPRPSAARTCVGLSATPPNPSCTDHLSSLRSGSRCTCTRPDSSLARVDTPIAACYIALVVRFLRPNHMLCRELVPVYFTVASSCTSRGSGKIGVSGSIGFCNTRELRSAHYRGDKRAYTCASSGRSLSSHRAIASMRAPTAVGGAAS